LEAEYLNGVRGVCGEAFQMKRITVTLTEDQATWVQQQLMPYEDLPDSHPENQFIYRIIKKFENALANS
jgi:hypothetical protein